MFLVFGMVLLLAALIFSLAQRVSLSASRLERSEIVHKTRSGSNQMGNYEVLRNYMIPFLLFGHRPVLALGQDTVGG